MSQGLALWLGTSVTSICFSERQILQPVEHLQFCGTVFDILSVININEFAVRKEGHKSCFGQDQRLQQRTRACAMCCPGCAHPQQTEAVLQQLWEWRSLPASWCCAGIQEPWIFSPFQVLTTSPQVRTNYLFSPRNPWEPPQSSSPKGMDLSGHFPLLNGLAHRRTSLHKSIVKINSARCCPRTANTRQGPSCNFLHCW